MHRNHDVGRVFVPTHGAVPASTLSKSSFSKTMLVRGRPRRLGAFGHQEFPSLTIQIRGVQHKTIDAQIGLQRVHILRHQ